MELMKNQIRTASGALWDVLLRTVPTAGATTWVVCYATDWKPPATLWGSSLRCSPYDHCCGLLTGGW